MKTDSLTIRTLDKKLATAIEAMDCRRGKEFHDVFDEFLDVSLGLMANNPNPHQVELLTRMRDNVEYKDAFVNAINAYGEAAQDYHDPLGDVFMERISHGNNGQFFTPEEMCRMTAQITESTNGYIMSKLDEIHSAKLGKVEPTHVTIEELSKAIDKEMRNTLNDLFCQGKIKVGDTLNGKYIVSHRWENSSRQQHTTAPTTSEH